ncbi:class I adenylate-forming enzyme family protein [Streptomyces sp. NPDC048172]|uniref:class I adenylate-forming enzyme family protein n=1 Tax=Streptomyces sp. NPDC048172 TaxID=3365505 RepID=UPI00371A75B5
MSPLTRARTLFSVDATRVLHRFGADHADRPLLVPPEPLEYPGYGTPELTGGQLRELGHRMAHALRARGVGVNTRVLIVKREHPDYLLYLYACIAAGAIPVSVNAATGWPYTAAVARLAGVRYVLTDTETLAAPGAEEELGPMLDDGVAVLRVGHGGGAAEPAVRTAAKWCAEHPAVTDFVDAVTRAPATAPPRRRTGHDTPLGLFHTSGTTGVPKLCIWSRRNTHRIWQLMIPTLPLGAGSRALLAVPFSHQIAFALATGMMLCGARVSTTSLYDPHAALAAIARDRISHVMAFPHLYMRMAAEDLDAYDLSSMRVWSVGADKAHAPHIARLTGYGSVKLPGRPRGSVFLDSYGSTEIGAGGILQVWLPGSAPEPCVQGKPMPTQYGLRIVDEHWRDVPRGRTGRILVRSSSSFDGYWDNHTRWAESRIDGWWWGGDVGRIDARGRLVFLDREADSVHTPGGMLRTLPFEERLLTHPRAMEAAVFRSGTDPATGLGRAEAWVAPRGVLEEADLAAWEPGARERLERELTTLVDDARLGPPLSAVRVVPLSRIPMGVTGKVLKRRLRELAEGEGGEPS